MGMNNNTIDIPTSFSVFSCLTNGRDRDTLNRFLDSPVLGNTVDNHLVNLQLYRHYISLYQEILS